LSRPWTRYTQEEEVAAKVKVEAEREEGTS
jgi:hypothetical protein